VASVAGPAYYKRGYDFIARRPVTWYYNAAREWIATIVGRPQTLEMTTTHVVAGVTPPNTYIGPPEYL
jgi:hypothetical protein